MGDGDVGDVVPSNVGVCDSFVDDREDGLEVAAGGDFGDDATVSFEDVDLGDDDVRKKFTVF